MPSEKSMYQKNNLANIEKEFGCSIGIHAYDLETKDIFYEHKQREQRVAASSIKLFFACAVMDVLKEKNLTLDTVVPIQDTYLIPGASVLADLVLQEITIQNLLYLLLTHSDTSAQNILEQVVSSEEVNTFIKKSGFENTLFVSNFEYSLFFIWSRFLAKLAPDQKGRIT